MDKAYWKVMALMSLDNLSTIQALRFVRLTTGMPVSYEGWKRWCTLPTHEANRPEGMPQWKINPE